MFFFKVVMILVIGIFSWVVVLLRDGGIGMEFVWIIVVIVWYVVRILVMYFGYVFVLVIVLSVVCIDVIGVIFY